ncbi:MAG: 16S rRNA (uracil(1498)-N(3))-methyltransferase [Geothrix sp.]|jgi:16S rRNA (uracil1498-N3)-methyltransferase|uniref:Ribosomal RNA small subunit methyltransferase E n=1 Tax=Candidatus Geothrix odensensis TaxID=2954440 RepID=A0A936F2W5_9BACT|nr:16S rRNA (uracil(1498)-N(3))-methyltransferase [Candidatus Geothrix odensensis]MBP7617020.1 16S rRNA (uracil(1498)-N(3))-methyltransferase [Geothrix sp.]MCC6514614.1 16S rRNA (uracil(1498)-N(3))-methyltransferase [Geothrix sp.]
MSLPRFFLAPLPAAENALVPLDAEAARHLKALRLKPGAALELVLGDQTWRADLAKLDRGRATARLVAPLHEDREPPVALQACLPLPAQLSLFDEWLPPLVELGITLIQPVVYRRSEFDAAKTAARMERWARLIQSACEQSHRSRLPELRPPMPFASLLTWEAPQRWVAYELATGQANPPWRPEALAFTSGPEGGITDEEFVALCGAGWQPVSLGRSILRAVTTPVALLGAVQYQLGGGRSAQVPFGGLMPEKSCPDDCGR